MYIVPDDVMRHRETLIRLSGERNGPGYGTSRKDQCLIFLGKRC